MASLRASQAKPARVRVISRKFGTLQASGAQPFAIRLTLNKRAALGSIDDSDYACVREKVIPFLHEHGESTPAIYTDHNTHSIVLNLSSVNAAMQTCSHYKSPKHIGAVSVMAAHMLNSPLHQPGCVPLRVFAPGINDRLALEVLTDGLVPEYCQNIKVCLPSLLASPSAGGCMRCWNHICCHSPC